MSDKRLRSGMCKEFSQLNNKKTAQFKNGKRIQIDIFQRGYKNDQ